MKTAKARRDEGTKARRARRISFKCTKAEKILIRQIVDKAVKLDYGQPALDPLSTEMDLLATHANGCPLDFKKLLSFDEFNLAHDVFGIRHHLDRQNGRLRDCFLPRCALPEGGQQS